MEKCPLNRNLVPYNEILKEGDIDHEKRFKEFCNKFNLNGETLKVLRSYDCDSLPALCYISKSDAEMSLVDNLINVGQQSKLRSAIDQLQGRGLPHPQSMPELHSKSRRENRICQDYIDSRQREKDIHHELLANINKKVSPKYFPEIKSAAGSLLEEGDLDPCQNLLALCRVLETRNCIRVGEYTNLIKILKVANLPQLVDCVKEAEREIQHIRHAEADTDGYVHLHRQRFTATTAQAYRLREPIQAPKKQKQGQPTQTYESTPVQETERRYASSASEPANLGKANTGRMPLLASGGNSVETGRIPDDSTFNSPKMTTANSNWSHLNLSTSQQTVPRCLKLEKGALPAVSTQKRIIDELLDQLEDTFDKFPINSQPVDSTCISSIISPVNSDGSLVNPNTSQQIVQPVLMSHTGVSHAVSRQSASQRIIDELATDIQSLAITKQLTVALPDQESVNSSPLHPDANSQVEWYLSEDNLDDNEFQENIEHILTVNPDPSSVNNTPPADTNDAPIMETNYGQLTMDSNDTIVMHTGHLPAKDTMQGNTN